MALPPEKAPKDRLTGLFSTLNVLIVCILLGLLAAIATGTGYKFSISLLRGLTFEPATVAPAGRPEEYYLQCCGVIPLTLSVQKGTI